MIYMKKMCLLLSFIMLFSNTSLCFAQNTTYICEKHDNDTVESGVSFQFYENAAVSVYGKITCPVDIDIVESDSTAETDISVRAYDEDIISYPVVNGNLYFNASSGTVTGCDYSVTSMDIPSQISGITVTSIEDYAFSSHTELISVSIPETVTSIGENPFLSDINLIDLTVDENNASYTVVDGMLCTKNMRRLICCVGGKVGKVDIPDGVVYIRPLAFANCEKITSVEFSADVTKIHDSAFSFCTGLTNIKLNESLKTIERNVFYNCTSLKNIYIPRGVSSIGEDIFSKAKSLESVNVSSDNENYTSVDGILYTKDKSRLIRCPINKSGRIVIDEETYTIEDYAFYNCGLVDEVVFPKYLSYIGCEAFTGCLSLYEITIPEHIYMFDSGVFSGCENLTKVTLPDGFVTIGANTFSGCINLKYIDIPDSVKTIGRNAFRHCAALEDINFPEELTEISDDAFAGCGSLKKAILPPNITSIGRDSFSDCYSLKEVFIPTGCTEIKDDAFYECGNLENITIPFTVENIGKNVFYGCSHSTVTMRLYKESYAEEYAKNNNWKLEYIDNGTYPVEGGYLYYESYWTGDNLKKILITGCDDTLTKVIVPEMIEDIKVIAIGSDAFNGCENLEEIVMPDTIYSIGECAFKDCTALKSITIPDSVTKMGEKCFYGCEKLDNVQLSDAMTEIKASCFENCKSIKNIDIPDSVKYIYWGAFSDCDSLNNVVVPDSVEELDWFVFSNCDSLTNIRLSNDLKSLDYTFSDCSSLKFVEIPESVKELYYTFSGCNAMTEFKIPGSVSILEGTFNECGNLEKVTIAEGTTDIGYNAFAGCPKLKNVGIPNSVEKIGDYAFDGCIELDPDIPSSVKEIGENAFAGSAASQIYIPLSANKISKGVYDGCKKLKKAEIPEQITEIGEYAFSLSGLEEIYIPESVTKIGEGAFESCENLKKVNLPSGLRCIEDRLFLGCGSLESCIIPYGVIQIGYDAFSECDGMKSLTIPSSVTKIEDDAIPNYLDITVICKKDSYAETFAKEHDIKYTNEGFSEKMEDEPHISTDPDNLDAEIIALKEIEYDTDKKTYDKTDFLFSVRAKKKILLDNYDDETEYEGKVNIETTLPEGFSFSKDIDERVRDSLVDVDFYDWARVYVKSPQIGDNTIKVKIYTDSKNAITEDYNVKVIKTGFQEDIYRANYNVNEGVAAKNIEKTVMQDNTPSESLKDGADKNGVGVAAYGWKAVKDVWNIIDDPSKVIDYPFEEKDMYKALIFDMLDCKFENEINDALSNKVFKETKSFKGEIMGILKDRYTYEQLTDNQFFGKNKDDVLKLVKNRWIEDHPQLDNVDTISGFLFKGADTLDNIYDVVEQVYLNYQVYMIEDSVKQYLADMYEAAPGDNIALKTALYEIKNVMESSEEEFWTKMAAYTTCYAGKKAAQAAVSELWNSIKNDAFESNPTLLMAYQLVKGSFFISDKFFNASKISEAYFKINAVLELKKTAEAAYRKEKSNFISNKSINNAKNYNSALNMLGSYYIIDCKTAKAYPEAVDSSWISKLTGFSADELKQSIENLKNTVIQEVDNANTSWINELEEDYPELYDYYYTKKDSYKVYNIACPVDVYVFDKDGVLMASCVGDKLYCDENANVTIFRNGDKKTVYTYDDEYTIIYKGTDNGKMDIEINEYVEGENTKTVNFNDVPLTIDGIYTQEKTGKFDESYNLKQDDKVINPDYEQNTTDSTYKLSINNGLVADTCESEGDFAVGQTVEIFACVPEGYKFIGWKSNKGTNIFDDTNSINTIVTMTDSDVVISADLIEDNAPLFGDVDCDNSITASDAASILQKTLVSTFELPIEKKTDDWMKYADVDCDTYITASDAAFILQKTLVSTFELPAEQKGR